MISYWSALRNRGDTASALKATALSNTERETINKNRHTFCLKLAAGKKSSNRNASWGEQPGGNPRFCSWSQINGSMPKNTSWAASHLPPCSLGLHTLCWLACFLLNALLTFSVWHIKVMTVWTMAASSGCGDNGFPTEERVGKVSTMDSIGIVSIPCESSFQPKN